MISQQRGRFHTSMAALVDATYQMRGEFTCKSAFMHWQKARKKEQLLPHMETKLLCKDYLWLQSQM